MHGRHPFAGPQHTQLGTTVSLAKLLFRVCLAQLNFTSEAVFLENSFMSDFLDKAELFWKKCLAK